MKIGELSKRCGLTAYTIRYYEGIGLLPRASRDASGHRDYDASLLNWIEFLNRLKTTGMPIRDMLRYAKLRERGSATGAERRHLLEQHRSKVRANLAELTASLAVLDHKISSYTRSEKRKDSHDKTNGIGRKPLRTRHSRPR